MKSKYENIAEGAGCLVIGFFICIILVIGLIWGSISKQKKINKLQHELTAIKERGVNDSILVSQYQYGMYEFIKNNPDCAENFSIILENLDLKQAQ